MGFSDGLNPRRGSAAVALSCWGREEGGLLCGIYGPSYFQLIHNDPRGGARGTQATRAHMTTAASHTPAARGARGLPSAVGRGHIRSQSASLLLVVLREVIRVRRRKANESQSSYQRSVIALIGRNVQYCKNLDCTYPELRRSDLTCLSSGV